MKIVGVHDSSLEEFHLGEMPFEETFQFQIGFLPMEKQNTIQSKLKK